nr:MAG TPA_asm: hypothetical protein [Caudoviricetes sp.]
MSIHFCVLIQLFLLTFDILGGILVLTRMEVSK